MLFQHMLENHGYLTLAELQELHNAGWTIANHGSDTFRSSNIN